MKTIWKYETRIIDRLYLSMPKNAEILCVQINEKTNIPCIWAMVETENEIDERVFELIGTGHQIHCDMGVDRKYIGTYQYQNGQFVGHLFELFLV